ncbi:reverse transcriptase domain-containing protein [Tanacetum coccineum]
MQRLSGKLTALNLFLPKATERVIPCRDTLKKCTNKKDLCCMEAVKEAFHAMKRVIVELPTLTAPIKDKELMVYLSVANEALSAVLLVERNRGRCDSLRDTMTGDDATSERTPSLKAILDSKEKKKDVDDSDKEYIEKGTLLDEPAEARTIREKINNYVIEDRVLYQKSYLGYYWPSMLQDANNEIKSYDACQAYVTVSRLPKDDMISVTSSWPFRKWGMDIVGPLLEAPGKLKYLIVVVDYFTKWFRVPSTIITDNGTHLINKPFKSWVEGMPTRRTTQRTNEENDVELRLNLNLLKEWTGEFILRKNELSKTENTGKLGPKWEGPYEVIEAYGT